MKITILAYQEADADRPDIVMDQVAEALQAKGHSAEVFAIHDDVAEVAEGLKKRKPELVFNLVEAWGTHDIIGGAMGVAGLLDLLEVPYTGGGPGELYLQEDKGLAKKLLAFEQVRYPDFATFAPNTEFETGGNLRMPLFVKPLRMDASLGIDEKSLVKNTQQLLQRVQFIHKTLGDSALAEEYIEGREFYVSVLGNTQTIAFPPIEMDFSGLPNGSLPVLDNKAKWDTSSERYHGTKAVLANVDPELKARLQRVALDAYRALRVRDYGRIDMRLTESGEIYVIEVNASCYLEKNSEFVVSAQSHGFDYPTLVNRIAELALERWKNRGGRKRKKRKTKRATST